MRGSLVVLVALIGCAADEPASREPPSGRITGTIRVGEGVFLEPTVVANTTDPEICGESQTLDDYAVSAETRGVENVIVSVTDVPDSLKPKLAPATLVLDNRDCRFRPHAAVLTVGSTLEATNSDDVLHTTHLYGPREVNFSLPARGASQSRELSHPGTFVVKCDLHGWMQAFLRVDDHPFHAVADADGRFHVDGVPVGIHTLEAWHERLGTLVVEVEVNADETTDVALEYRSEKTK